MLSLQKKSKSTIRQHTTQSTHWKLYHWIRFSRNTFRRILQIPIAFDRFEMCTHVICSPPIHSAVFRLRHSVLLQLELSKRSELWRHIGREQRFIDDRKARRQRDNICKHTSIRFYWQLGWFHDIFYCKIGVEHTRYASSCRYKRQNMNLVSNNVGIVCCRLIEPLYCFDDLRGIFVTHNYLWLPSYLPIRCSECKLNPTRTVD